MCHDLYPLRMVCDVFHALGELVARRLLCQQGHSLRAILLDQARREAGHAGRLRRLLRHGPYNRGHLREPESRLAHRSRQGRLHGQRMDAHCSHKPSGYAGPICLCTPAGYQCMTISGASPSPTLHTRRNPHPRVSQCPQRGSLWCEARRHDNSRRHIWRA